MTTLPFRFVYSIGFDFIRFLLSIVVGPRTPPGVAVCVCVRVRVCVCGVCVRERAVCAYYITLLTPPSRWQWLKTQLEM